LAESRGTAVPASLGRTLRRDAWWTEAIPVIILLGGFGVYATLRAFEGKFYEWGPYLSPFYSPLIDASHRWWHWSPALLILAFPLGFRMTCYYYRKAYYRAFFLDPPACAVGESPHRNYRGETGFPFILQNLHRYFLYGAIVFLCFLWYDAIRHRRRDADIAGEHHFSYAVPAFMPLASPPARGQAGLFFLYGLQPLAPWRVEKGELPQ
jgi:hypothetical protein